MNTFLSRSTCRLSPATSLLKTTLAPKLTSVPSRNFLPKNYRLVRPHQKWPNWNWKWKNGKEYVGFTYYPRFPDQPEPAWEKTPLFMVERVKSYKGNPYWEKQILKQLRIDLSMSQRAIVINGELQNKYLWKIKHLIKITPITFPDGYPTKEDIPYCYLYENGEFRINKSLTPNAERMRAIDELHKHQLMPNKICIERDCRHRWDNPITNNVVL